MRNCAKWRVQKYFVPFFSNGANGSINKTLGLKINTKAEPHKNIQSKNTYDFR